MKANFPANDYETVEPDLSGTTARCAKVTDQLGERLVRFHYKYEVPRSAGLVPHRIEIGAFGWRWWGLRDDWGRLLAKRM